MNEYQKLLKNYNNLSNDLNTMNDKYLNKEKECLIQQRAIYNLKNENKKIIILNKNLNEKENQIKELKNIIKLNNDEISNHQKEKRYLNEQIQNYSNNEEFFFKTKQTIQDYENIVNDIRNNYNKQLKNKEFIINDYKNNIMRNKANNENLISYIIKQIQILQDNFEKFDREEDDYFENNYPRINENDTKYELIHQNFVLLTQKLKEFRRKNNSEIIRLRNELEVEKNNNKQLLDSIDLNRMKNNSIENNIIELKKIIDEKNKKFKFKNKFNN
jgi:hypothetical protein